MKAKEEKLRKALVEVTRLEGEFIKFSYATTTEALELKAKLEAVEDQARTTAILVVSEFQALDEMR